MLLTEFDIDYMAKKVVKGRAVADFLAQNSLTDEEEWELEFPDEYLGAIDIQGWKMHLMERSTTEGQA